MFEIRCIVGDKKLSDALRALKGHTIEHPVVLPVDAETAPVAAPTNGSDPVPKKKYKRRKPLVQGGKHRTGQGTIQIARDLLAKSGVDKISAREIKQAVMAVGYSHGAYSHAIKILLKEKVLKPTESMGEYIVTHPHPHQSSETQVIS